MRTDLRRLVTVCAAVLAVLATGAAASAAEAAKPAPVFGVISAVDPAKSTFSVRTQAGPEVSLRFDTTTSFEAIRPATAEDVPDGTHVKVTGKVSDDQTRISATAIEKLTSSARGWAAVRPEQYLVTGTLSRKADGTLSVAVNDRTVAVVPKESLKYGQRGPGTSADLKADVTVWATVAAGSEQDGTALAERVILTLY